MTPIHQRACFATLAVFSLALSTGCEKTSKNDGSAAKTASSRQSSVLGQGKILPLSGFANLGAPGLIIEKVHVSVGNKVEAGAPLLTLKRKAALEKQIAGAKAKVSEIEQTQINSTNQAKTQMEIALLKKKQINEQLSNLEPDQKNAVRLANEQLGLANAMLQKLEKIKAEPLTAEFVGTTEIEQQRSVIKDVELQIEQQSITTKKTRDQLNASLQAASKEFDLAKTLYDSAVKSRALEVAKAELAVLEQQLEMTEVSAPFSGLVVAVNVSDGGIGTALPPIVMADLSNVVCEAEINERDAGEVSLGDKATITSSAFKDKALSGEVIRKSSVVGEPQLQTFDPLARVDYRAITVVIEFDEEDKETVKNWLKLQVDVEISPSKTAKNAAVPAG